MGWKPVQKGVPQGSELSPTLFNTLVRELPPVCDMEMHQFADDASTSKADKNINVVLSSLKQALIAITGLCESKDLK